MKISASTDPLRGLVYGRISHNEKSSRKNVFSKNKHAAGHLGYGALQALQALMFQMEMQLSAGR